MPSYIDNTNPKFLLIDDIYFAGLVAVNYSKEQKSFLIDKLIKSNKNINISMFYEKQDAYKIIRDLTYHIGNAKVTIKDSTESMQDIDNIMNSLEGAKYIRREMQMNKEEFFYFYLYILTFAKTKEELEDNLRQIENCSNGMGVFVRRANFRQKQLFQSSLPLMKNSCDLKEIAKRNVLSKDLVATYPFVMSQIYDENGILFGINSYDNCPVIIDVFNQEKYKNSNICIFGTSGSRKIIFYKTSCFTKCLYEYRTIYNRSGKRIFKCM